MKIIFIIPPSFLRAKAKTDPFYDPIIRALENRLDIDWKVFIWDKCTECGYPSEKIGDYRLLDSVGIWFCRFCRLFAWRIPSWKIYRLFGVLARPFFARKFAADVVITQAGQFAEVFDGLLPRARIVDIQHGVIYSRHSGYFDKDARLLPIYQSCVNREFWVYGQGYADCFFKHPDNMKDLKGRVKVVGDVIRAGEKVGTDGCSGRDEKRNVVVFSLQLTADLSREEMVASVAKMEEFFADFFRRFGDKYVCYVKHHPRFNNVYDLSSFYAKFPQVKETRKPWTDLYGQIALHVTFTSTVTFDCASKGIPTVLLDLPSAQIINRAYYNTDYNYPYFNKNAQEILSMPKAEVRETVLSWYRRFYSPFDEKRCLALLRGCVE